METPAAFRDVRGLLSRGVVILLILVETVFLGDVTDGVMDALAAARFFFNAVSRLVLRSSK